MIDKKNLLICGAFDGEIDLLQKNSSLNILVSGVGELNSVFNITRYLKQNPNIGSLLFCGSCGAYPGQNYAIGEIVYSKHFFYQEIAELRGIVKVPDLIEKEIMSKIPEGFLSSFESKKIRPGKTNSVNSITISDLDPGDKNFFGSKDISFENMESFGIAYIAKKLSLSYAALFSVTNNVGKNGSDEWKKNWRECSNRLQHLIPEILE
ncbi:MAG: hypothetical protein K8R21_04675 [Leptospira sp.]|nr:hypothetical protein [Leptospira sp.]